jgi:LacI family transcriptional regulator
MASVKDVAARAGVSVGTVSRVINGFADVRPEMRERVERAMRELDYRPNQLARNFRRQTTQTIGVIVPDITAPFFADLVKQCEAVARDAGWSVLIGNSDNRVELEDEYISRLRDRGIDGLLLVPSSAEARLARDEAARIVVVDQELEGLDFVATDHEAGARDAVEHLIALGHRRIACIGGFQTSSRQRLAGYRAVMAPLLEPRLIESYVRIEPVDDQWGIHAAEQLLDLPEPPTAIFATSDQQAVGVLRACADRDLRVPGDLSVVGFDDIPLAGLVQPRLTTIRQQTSVLGRLAVSRLLERLDAPWEDPVRRVVPGELLLRRSSGPVPPGR